VVKVLSALATVKRKLASGKMPVEVPVCVIKTASGVYDVALVAWRRVDAVEAFQALTRKDPDGGM
jgi:hypothetical protein